MKAAVIGLGVGKEHIKAYQESDVSVVCLVDRDKPLRESFGVSNTASSIGTIAEPAPGLAEADVVSICSHDQFHFEQIKICLELGKHVIVEKPPCLRHDEVHRLREMVDASRKVFACNLPLTMHPEIQRLAEDDQGDIYMIEAEYNWGRRNKLLEWRKDCPGYSLVLGGGLHMIDLMLWLKEWEIVDGAAFGVNRSTPQFNGFETIQSIFKFADGTLGRMTVNGGYNGAHTHRVVISGTKGVATWLNMDPVDKGAVVRAAVNRIRNGSTIDNTRLWHALEVCFGIEANARQG